MAQLFCGVRVVEVAQFVFVPAAGAMLADQGAEVIHVEMVGQGDPYRSLKINDGRETQSANLSMEQNNRGKKSIAIDLKSAAGRAVFLRLIETADVFLTSLRPKAIEQLGLGVEALRARNPRLIYARGNGVGFAGRERDKAGYDASAFWARGGFAHALRPAGQDAPLLPRPALGDHASAVSVSYGIAAALYRRAVTGEATVVETSLLASAIWTLSADIVVNQAQKGGAAPFAGSRVRTPLKNSYRTNDGRHILLMFLDPDRYWVPLCRHIGRTDLLEDARFATPQARDENAAALIKEIACAIEARRWAEWQPIFEAWDAPWELVKTIGEVADDPQAAANGYLFDVAVADGTAIRLASSPVSFDGRSAPDVPVRSPLLGEHTEAILLGLGLRPDEVQTLRAQAAVG